MLGIEFEEDKDIQGFKTSTGSSSTEKPSIAMKLIEKAGVTDKMTANFILLGIAIIFFGISIYLYSGLLKGSKPLKLAPEQLQAQLKLMQGARTHQNK